MNQKIFVIVIAVLSLISMVQAAAPTTRPLAASEGPQVIRGTVEVFRSFKLKEVAEPQLLAKVRMKDGTVIVASIGSANTFGAGRVQHGTIVGMLGQMGSINGKDVFFAQRVETQAPTTQTSTTAPSAR
jgi:hypothetical protein